ncbi:MAG: 2Fe-2S iron-sulfur cluster binding domain-containing protein [Actinobacteria bacterium]|nr:2Fe-2S iron-sulfur cluster binding domain-containing protein [Actinomycetota bacterium]
MTTELSLRINGATHAVEVDVRKTLADVLRDDLGMHGTHLGCEHGVCGACTVLLDGRPVRACLIFAVQCENASITTIEGLADGERLHPVQQAFIDNFGLQCGFCTPGFIMLAAGALAEKPDMDDEELRELLSSNLCRCTGYRSILLAVKQAAAAMRPAAR